MKRLSLCVFVVLAACLLLAPVALASTKAKHVAPDRVRHVTAAPRSYARLGADPTYSISGHVLDFAGNPVQGAEVDWGWWDSLTNYHFGDTNMPLESSPGTGSDGSFSFPAVSGGHQNNSLPSDDLRVWYYPTQPGLEFMEDFALDFATNNDATLPSAYSYEMQPAQVNVNIAHAPGSLIEVRAGNSNYGFARADVTLDTGGNGSASVLPMDTFDDVVGYYYTPLAFPYVACRSQVEWLGTSPVSVTAGSTATDAVDLDWSNAQHAALYGPLCRHSGKPGTKVSMVLTGWPAGEQAVLGGTDYQGVSKFTDPTAPSTGAAMVATLTVPTAAALGPYEIDAYRSDNLDSLVDMWDIFQVCTLKPSVSSILHGHAVRLSGRVPSTGSVTVYSTWHKVTMAPGTLAATGWHKVGVYKTYSSGKFVSSLLRPSRTQWYVVRYKGYAFQAFTSVIKVTVH